MPGQHIRAQAGDVIDDPEVYAIYASVLPARFSSGDMDLTRIALLDETRAKMECLPELGPDWEIVLENYKKENARGRRFVPGFDVGLPYTLVSSTEVDSLIAESLDKIRRRMKEPDGPLASRPFDRFPNGKVLSFSAVGFDAAKTRAVVTVQYRCGFDCSGGWHVLREKNGGRWGPPAGNAPTCTWIS